MSYSQSLCVSVALGALCWNSPLRAEGTPPALPPHVLREIKLTVQGADAIFLGTVQAPARNGKVRFKVDKSLKGIAVAEVELPITGFYAPDLEPSAQLLVSLKKIPSDAWSGTG